MTPNPDKLIDAMQTNMLILQDMTTHAFSGIQKLVELNLETMKASTNEALSHAQSCLAARDAAELQSLQAGLLQPLALKFFAYRSQRYAIIAETCSDMVRDYSAAVENVEKKVPAIEPMIAVMKSAASASQIAIETAQSTAKQTLELVETNLSAANHQATRTAAPTPKKRSHSAG